MVVDPTNPTVPILEPLSKMTKGNKKQYIADVRVMNYLLQEIPNDIYNSVDALQFEPHILVSRAKKAAKNHDLLALITHSNASSSHSHANSSYSTQPYYVIHPPSVVDHDDEYQGELQCDSQEDKLTTAMMMVKLTYKPRMEVMVEMLIRMQGETELKGLMQVMKAIRLFSVFHEKPKVRDSKYFREQMLLAMKDEAGSNLSNEENDFMLDTSYGEDLEELTAAVHASSKVHEQVSHGKRKTIIQTMDDDQIDSNIIFDDPFVENNGGTSEHDSTAHDEYREIQMLAYNVQHEVENKKLSRERNTDSNLYTISISEMAASSPVCLMSKATSTKSWLWHRRLSHLNFGTINHLTSHDLVDGLPKFKYNKNHLCSACEQGIVHKTSIARTPQQNEVVERSNRTLIEAARTMLIFSKAPEFLWAEPIATACFTQNRSIVHTRHNKTLYELICGQKPNVQYFHVFGSLCYPTNYRDDLGKMKPKADIGIFVSYSESSRGFRIYNRRTKKIMETIHVKFDELTTMASECNNLEPEMYCTNFNDSSEDS
ncbi:integrase, catalytic region, zinc finger, CCHC-type containing protein [Tanacetum coccineum]